MKKIHPITGKLEANTRKRRVAEARLEEMRREADAMIVEGDRLGVPKLTLARAAGMTRQTIYTVLLRSKAGV